MLAALAQVNVTVGALIPNADKVIRVASEAWEKGARLIVFPEMVLAGYPPEDLVLKPHFLEDCGVEIARLAAGLPPEALVLVGAPHREAGGDGRPRNAAYVFHRGFVRGIAHKMLLPNYGVFDEKRVFAEGARPSVIRAGPYAIGVHICEDSWVPEAAPCRAMRGGVLDLLVNLSASPYHRSKALQRQSILRRAAAAVDAPALYCNLVGGQDELVFDGTSLAVAPDGTLLARGKAFEEDLLFVEVPMRLRGEEAIHPDCETIAVDWAPATVATPPAPRYEPLPDAAAEVYAALVLGLRDYVNKNGFRRCVVALSGGIDSALVATIAADALGADRVAGVTMPSRYSSAETRGDAELLARTLGIEFHSIPIEGVVAAFLKDLSPVWPGRAPDITEENLQARIRGVMIMALSNKFGWLVLTTGNKSEMATGYCTLYGDMSGGFALIKDVPKTLVFELARWRNARGPAPVIPPSTIERPPSAELRPDQRDTDSLPPYDVLDPILERYVEQDQSFDRIVAGGFDPAVVRRVIRLVDTSEYKRRQGAPGVKITPRAFGRDRRMPITNLYRERT
ncbi:MAG: NAD+ synthase [Lentisphaerae bacterium]|nr:NAD+ synthase [Lentisphaerota bacterium]